MLAACGGELKSGSRVRKLTLLSRYVSPRMPWETYTVEEAIFWTCECVCAETVVVEESKLINGTVHSCKKCSNKKHGNEKDEPLITNFSGELALGTVIGELELVERVDGKKWKAKCSCGRIVDYTYRPHSKQNQKIRMCAECFGKRMEKR